MSTQGSIALFDASALLKVFCDEDAASVRFYWGKQATKYTSPFCLYEVLSLLKQRMVRRDISRDEYFNAAARLSAWYMTSNSRRQDIDFTDPLVFKDAAQLAKQHDLDLSDSFQLLSLMRGYFSLLSAESNTVLVTADGAVAEAARYMNLIVWNCLRDGAP